MQKKEKKDDTELKMQHYEVIWGYKNITSKHLSLHIVYIHYRSNVQRNFR